MAGWALLWLEGGDGTGRLSGSEGGVVGYTSEFGWD